MRLIGERTAGAGPVSGKRCRVRAEDLHWRLARRQASWLPGPLCRLSGTMVLRAARGDPHWFAQGLAWRLPDADRLTTLRMLAPDAQQRLVADLPESYRQGPR